MPGADGGAAIQDVLAVHGIATLNPDAPPETVETCRSNAVRAVREMGHSTEAAERMVEEAIQASVSSGSDPEWPSPERIPDGLPPVEPFAPLLLPDGLRPWIQDIADRIQCPLDYPAVASMVALGSVVGRQVGIRPKHEDDWQVVPNLWGMIVGRPGVLKTPAVQEVLKPATRLEVEAKEEHDTAVLTWKAGEEVRSVERKVRGEYIKKQLKAGADARALAHELSGDQEDAEPQRRRYVVNDATVEKLGELLSGNPNGVCVSRDELTGWLRGLSGRDAEPDRAFYLEAWNGTGRFAYDRIGRGTVDIEAACVSILGTIQPGPLRSYQTGEAGGAEDGLIQRFQLAVWPDVATDWRNVDRAPDREARERAFDLFKRLAHLDVDQLGAERDPFDPDVPFLRFGPVARQAFDRWRGELERRVRSAHEHPAVESHLAKYRSLVPSLALLHHLASLETSTDVGESSVLTGIAWVQYLESHARRIYTPITGTDNAPALALAHHIETGDLISGLTVRDVYRPQWTGLRTRQEAERAVEILEDLGWLRPVEWETGGRPKTTYSINPEVTR